MEPGYDEPEGASEVPLASPNLEAGRAWHPRHPRHPPAPPVPPGTPSPVSALLLLRTQRSFRQTPLKNTCTVIWNELPVKRRGDQRASGAWGTNGFTATERGGAGLQVAGTLRAPQAGAGENVAFSKGCCSHQVRHTLHTSLNRDCLL